MEFIQIVIYASIYLGLVATVFYVLSYNADKKRNKPFFKDSELSFVTVIIPAYNEENSIAKTIESIKNADYPKNKYEVFVVDDGSKDNTFKIAKKYQSKLVKVFHKENGGKASALNYGIKKSKGEFVFSMDADTFADPKSMKLMIRYFKNPKVMAVTPAMLIHRPKSILQRIQHVEFLLGLFLRKTFAALNAVYITPGAFSVYRKTFFDKYGGYDEDNITEDLELSIRIQSEGYQVENCPEAPVYTIAPSKFKELLIQRRRWYFGLIKNLIKYKQVISTKYGDLGTFVIPISLISMFFAVFITAYLFFKTILNVQKELLFYKSIDFGFSGIFNLNLHVIERTAFLFLTNPTVLFILFFVAILGFYISYASKKVGGFKRLFFDLPLFFLFFAILFGFWWIVSLFYLIFVGKISWR